MPDFELVDVTVALSGGPNLNSELEGSDRDALMADLRREGLDDEEIMSLLGHVT